MAETITRDGLFQALCEHWQHTEDAIAAAGEHFDKAGLRRMTVGDIFRHLTSIAHDTASQVREMIATGEHILSTAEENEAGGGAVPHARLQDAADRAEHGARGGLDVHPAFQR